MKSKTRGTATKTRPKRSKPRGSKIRVRTIVEVLTDKVQALPADKQQQVLDFVEFLERRLWKGPRRSMMGLLADLNIHLTEEEIDEARRECWAMTPKEKR